MPKNTTIIFLIKKINKNSHLYQQWDSNPYFPSMKRGSYRLNYIDTGAPSESWTPDTVIMEASKRFELLFPLAYYTGALPLTELTKVTCSTIWANGAYLIPQGGIEPPTCGIWVRYSTYWVIVALLIAIYVLMGNHSTRRLIFTRNLTKTSLD